MLSDVLTYLRCPHCAGGLARVGGVVRCDTTHVFDVARQGYLSLLGPTAPAGRGDTAAMVAARESFLAGGHYSALADAVAAACEQAVTGVPGCVVDVGAGTGFYLRAVLERLPARHGVALDLSKYALRRAARAHPRIGAVACDVWGSLPVGTGVAAAAVNVFAPRSGPELRRILRPGGVCVVVTPTSRHLAEIVGVLDLLTVDERKQQRLHAHLAPHLEARGERAVEFRMALGRDAVQDLVAMGPTAWHQDRRGVARRVAALPEPVTVTASFRVATYARHTSEGRRPRDPPPAPG